MLIREVSVSNFRALGETRLELGDMTALIGSNGSGKTALLLAIGRFFGRQQTMNAANFGSREDPIRVTVMAEGRAGDPVEVTREWRWDEEQGRAASTGYSCGKSVAARLGGFLVARAVYVPTGLEISGGGRDRWGAGDTALQSLINSMTGHNAAGNAGREGGSREASRIDPRLMEETLNEKLGARDGIGYAPNIRVRLDFGDPKRGTGLRMAVVDRETGRGLDYAHVGHGARRALHMAALETDADILGRGGAGGTRGDTATLYIIDEPELHQHPQRQALIFDALRRLSGEPSSQVIYATHSPHFVSLGAQMGICRVRRAGAEIGIQGTIGGGSMPVREGVARPIGEAIFSNGAILVEGLHDEAIIRAVLRATPHDGGTLMSALAGREVAVVNCRSKYNIEHYYRILDSLGIACFVVWDGDMGMEREPGLGQAKRHNRRLLEMVGAGPGRAAEIEGAGSDECIIGDGWACFGHNLPAYFAKYFGLDPKRLKGKIRGGVDIVQWLDRERLFQSEFYRRALHSMCRTLIK